MLLSVWSCLITNNKKRPSWKFLCISILIIFCCFVHFLFRFPFPFPISSPCLTILGNQSLCIFFSNNTSSLCHLSFSYLLSFSLYVFIFVFCFPTKPSWSVVSSTLQSRGRLPHNYYSDHNENCDGYFSSPAATVGSNYPQTTSHMFLIFRFPGKCSSLASNNTGPAVPFAYRLNLV